MCQMSYNRKYFSGSSDGCNSLTVSVMLDVMVRTLAEICRLSEESSSFVRLESIRQRVSPKRLLISTRLSCVTLQKAVT